MKKLRKIVPAFVLLLVAMSMLGTATFAWFSMNNKVTLTGMEVTTKVSNNLSIASSVAGTTAVAESNFANKASQNVSAKIVPVSTVNGVNFFYADTTKVNADGTAVDNPFTAYDEDEDISDTAAKKTQYDAAFQLNYGESTAITTANVVYGYVDYVVELKATNTSTTDPAYVNLSKIDLIYKGVATDTQKAFRTAMFIQEAASYDTDGRPTAYNAMGNAANAILDVTGALNHTDDYAVSAENTAPTEISIMATASRTSYSVPENETKYIKVTLRLYIEGEDKTCTNQQFVQLSEGWKLDVSFTLDEANTGSKTEITKYTGKTLNVNERSKLVYMDSNGDLFIADDLTQLNGTGANSKKILTSVMSAAEVETLNTEYNLSGEGNVFVSVASYSA